MAHGGRRLAHAFLELNRREPGLGHPLQAACEARARLVCKGASAQRRPPKVHSN